MHSASEAYTVEGTQAKYDKKTAITYSWDDSIMDEVVHPVIRTHPETGRKALYVNDMFTLRIQGNVQVGKPRTARLSFHSCHPPRILLPFRWSENAVAIWDNRCMQHYAVDDYQAYERLMYRVTIEGCRPV